jgi:FkbM family methyltransferase
MMKNVIEEIKSICKSKYQADFLQAVFQKYLDEVIIQNHPIILFGAGSAGVELAECLILHDVVPLYFCDTNSERIGHEYLGIPVISFEQAKKEYRHAIFVIATNNFKDEIKVVLRANGIPKWTSIDNKDQFFYYLQIYKWHHPFETLDLDQVQQAYDLLQDDASKSLFVGRIALLSSYADYGLFREFIQNNSYNEKYPVGNEFVVSEHTYNYESFYYFNNDVLKLEDHEVLIDGGAFDGDSAKEFIKACELKGLTYDEIFCIEADSANYEVLSENFRDNEKVTPINLGLWSSKTQLKFANSETMFITEARIIDSSIEMARSEENVSNATIDTIKIDDIGNNQKISFIKMDIEGAELEALKGAERVLRRDKPKLAISLYHKKTDIYEIPLFIHSICPEYKIYIRHFSSNLCETVMLAYV